jgi:hypothetical protein
LNIIKEKYKKNIRIKSNINLPCSKLSFVLLKSSSLAIVTNLERKYSTIEGIISF